jgi:hypothetical protein
LVEYRIGWHEAWLTGRRMGVKWSLKVAIRVVPSQAIGTIRVMITMLKRPISVRSWIIADALCRIVFGYQNTVMGYRAGFKSKRE